MKTFFTYFILFLIYSFVGWAIEVVVTFNKDKKFVNRGFFVRSLLSYIWIFLYYYDFIS